MVSIDLRQILDTFDLPDGRRVVLLNWVGKSKLESARNIFLLGVRGEVVWQVNSEFDSEGAPFTKINSYGDGKLRAFRWDGGMYEIDIKTGFAIPKEFMK